MPAEPSPTPVAPEQPAAGVAEFAQAIALVRGRLDELADRRRRDGALTDGWQGGHRVRFEDARAEADRLARRLDDTLARLALVSRRALDEGGR